MSYYDKLKISFEISFQVVFKKIDKPMCEKFEKVLTTLICYKDTRNCQEKVKKISHLKPNQLAPSIYIMKELCFFSLDQWEISIHLLWGKCFNIPHHCDPHLNQTKLNGLLPLTIPGVLVAFFLCHTWRHFNAISIDNVLMESVSPYDRKPLIGP